MVPADTVFSSWHRKPGETCMPAADIRWWASGTNEQRAPRQCMQTEASCSSCAGCCLFPCCLLRGTTGRCCCPCASLLAACVSQSEGSMASKAPAHVRARCTVRCWTHCKTQAGMRGLCLRPWTLLLLLRGGAVVLHTPGHATPTHTTKNRMPWGPCY